MRRVVLKMDMSLDGYVGPLDEDAEWIMRDFDGELSQWVVDEVLWQAGTHVMGRATYEEMADHSREFATGAVAPTYQPVQS
ncbi:MAG: hypothetical protein ACRDOS_11095 [Gaiellaceae bacterium]